MREHEVPTHVQAEDKVLLWFTFPQIVAITAVCALSYGAYRYAPVGPSELRMAIAILFGLAGIALVVGKIGGRRLPLVAADLLKYRLGARRYVGPTSQLVRNDPPTPSQPARSGPGPLKLMARRSKRVLRNLRKKKNRKKGRRDGQMPFRPLGWFGKRRRKSNVDQGAPVHKAETLDEGSRRPVTGWSAVLVAAVVVAAATATVPQAVLADGQEPWRDEIDFELAEPVAGRRVFVEKLTVAGDRAAVTFRAATDLDIRVRAFGGPDGTWLRFWGSATLGQGERIDYSLPLQGPAPSFTVSWEDGLGQAGGLTVGHEQIPHPLPEVEGELCTVRLTSLGWTPGAVEGAVESDCVNRIEHSIELQTVTGYQSVTATALMEAGVTGITGTVLAASAASTANVAFVPDGETRFRLVVPTGEAMHLVSVDATLEADLNIPIPPLTELIHHPERTEPQIQTVSLWRPGTTRTVSETVTVTHGDGTTTQHVVSATLSVPGETVYRDVTLAIVHPEHVEAEVVHRTPVVGSRDEVLQLATAVGSDDPYAVLAVPQPEPEEPPAEQTPANGLQFWFDLLGWEWPW